MKDCIFGNLMDWGDVLEKLDHLKETNGLDNYQHELIRLFRFDGNWRLREAAVEAAAGLAAPDIETIQELTDLMKRDDLYYNLRIMATQALSALVPVLAESQGADKGRIRRLISETGREVDRLMAAPAPPIFHDALDTAFGMIQKAGAVAAAA